MVWCDQAVFVNNIGIKFPAIEKVVKHGAWIFAQARALSH